jgi:hypothetical protein
MTSQDKTLIINCHRMSGNLSTKNPSTHCIKNLATPGAGQVFLPRRVLRTFQIRQMLGSEIEANGSFNSFQ